MGIAAVGATLLAAALGAWASYYGSLRASEVRYDAIVGGTHQREWVANLQSAVAEYLGTAQFFGNGYLNQLPSGEEKLELYHDVAIAHMKVRTLLNDHGKQRDLRERCLVLYRLIASDRVPGGQREEIEQAIEDVSDHTTALVNEELTDMLKPTPQKSTHS